MAKIEGVYSQWGYGAEGDSEGEILTGGLHEDFEITKENAAHIAGGESAGAVRILEASDAERALLEGHVESQEDSEAAYDAAQKDGSWREGHLAQFVADTETRLALSNEEANLTDGDREWLTNGLASAYDELGDEDAASAVRARASKPADTTGEEA